MHNTFPHPRSLLLVARLQIICSFRFVLMKIGFRSGPLCASLFYVARSFFDYKDDAHICTSSQTHNTLLDTIPCSAELISTTYQPWNSVFLSQQISHSRLISQKTVCRTGPISLLIIACSQTIRITWVYISYGGWRFKSWQVKSVPSQAHQEGSLASGQAHKEGPLRRVETPPTLKLKD
jgi:hypothetical protein